MPNQYKTHSIRSFFNSWFGADAKKENLGTYHRLLFLCLPHLWIQSDLSFEAGNRVCTRSVNWTSHFHSTIVTIARPRTAVAFLGCMCYISVSFWHTLISSSSHFYCLDLCMNKVENWKIKCIWKEIIILHFFVTPQIIHDIETGITGRGYASWNLSKILVPVAICPVPRNKLVVSWLFW